MRVPTAIAVTSADLVLPAPDRHTPGAALLHPPEQLDLESALAEAGALLERHGHLVALVPPWLPRSTVQRLHTVRAILETDRIALLGIDLPPLGTALLARQLRQLSVCDFSPGIIASAARLLSHYIYAGALLGSVAKLDRVRVPVGLGAHARSWSPSAQFAVMAHPKPHLAKLGTGAGGHGAHGPRSGVLPAGPEFATHLTFARGQLTSDWVTAELAPAWQVQGVMENPLPAASAGWWGPRNSSSSPPASRTCPCSTSWSPRSAGRSAAGAASNSSATAAASARRRSPHRRRRRRPRAPPVPDPDHSNARMNEERRGR